MEGWAPGRKLAASLPLICAGLKEKVNKAEEEVQESAKERSAVTARCGKAKRNVSVKVGVILHAWRPGSGRNATVSYQTEQEKNCVVPARQWHRT